MTVVTRDQPKPADVAADDHDQTHDERTSQWATFQRLLRYVTHQRSRFIAAGILAFIAALTLGVIPVILGTCINIITAGGTLDELGTALLVLLVLVAILWLTQWWSTRLLAQVAQQAMYDLRTEFFSHIQTLSLNFYDRQPVGELMSGVTNDLDAVNQFLSNGLLQVFQAVFGIVVTLTVMLIINVPMTVLSLLMMPLLILAVYVLSRMSGPAFSKLQEELGSANGFMEETLAGEPTLIAYNRGEAAADRLTSISEEVYNLGRRAQISALMTSPVTDIINNLQTTIIGLVGSLLVIRGVFPFGVVLMFVMFSSQLQTPVQQIARIVNLLLQALAGGKRVFAILDERPSVQDGEDARDIPIQAGRVEFKHVDFSYVPGRQILKDNTFVAEPGQKIGLCGPTGAGKSTIINILTRYYDIERGEIAIDGVNITDFTQESLRKQIAVVLQEPFLFTATIMDNLRVARADATDEEIIDAAKQANAHDFIMHLPQGYETLLVGGGENLSQGQRQMLTIARAMVMRPRMLILDEATSNVDTRTEKLINQGLRRLQEGRTSFVIAHRLSTIQDSDRILVINAGTIIEQGTHHALMDQRGFYYRLYQSQFRNSS